MPTIVPSSAGRAAGASVVSRLVPVGAVALALALATASAHGGESLALPNPVGDDEETPWTEIQAELPAYPETENLLPFTVGAVRDTRFFVDGTSLTLGADGVLRYTLVIVSAGGARNVSREGMRCATRERRSYAFGRSDKTWAKARNAKWVPVTGGSNNPYVDLYTNYFCAIGADWTAEQALRGLRSGGKKTETGR